MKNLIKIMLIGILTINTAQAQSSDVKAEIESIRNDVNTLAGMALDNNDQGFAELQKSLEARIAGLNLKDEEILVSATFLLNAMEEAKDVFNLKNEMIDAGNSNPDSDHIMKLHFQHQAAEQVAGLQ